MFNIIINKLEEKLNTLGVKVYRFENTTIEQYPAIIIVPLSYEDTYLSLGHIKRQYTFRLRLLHYIDGKGDLSNAQQKLIDLVDDVLNLLNNRSNITLDGVVDFSILSKGEFKIIEREGIVYLCEIDYNVFKSITF